MNIHLLRVRVRQEVVRVHLNATRVHHPGLGFKGLELGFIRFEGFWRLLDESMKFLVKLQPETREQSVC